MSSLEQLQRLWMLVPDVQCKGLCVECCGPIAMSDAEAELIQERILSNTLTVVPDINFITIDNNGQTAKALINDGCQDGCLTCPLLVNDRCSVYDIRPLICRIWGATKELKCPHGCKPLTGYLKNKVSRRLIKQANAI